MARCISYWSKDCSVWLVEFFACHVYISVCIVSSQFFFFFLKSFFIGCRILTEAQRFTQLAASQQERSGLRPTWSPWQVWLWVWHSCRYWEFALLRTSAARSTLSGPSGRYDSGPRSSQPAWMRVGVTAGQGVAKQVLPSPSVCGLFPVLCI